MNKSIFKWIIVVIAILAIIIGIMYLIDFNRMKNGEEVIFSTWGTKYAPVLAIRQNNNVVSEKYQKYSKTINNVHLELNIPNEWKYKEVQKNEDESSYEYALKLYKNSEEQYAMLYIYNNQFGVCGTGRTSKNITLNNGNEATVGYYDGNKNWSDISFYSMNKNMAVINYGLIDNDAEEVIEFIKTINIVYLSTENSNKKPENVTIEVLENTITNKAAEILITDNNKNQYGWGVEFRVQQKIDGKWKELNYISDDLAWIEIAYELDKNNQVKMKVDFEKYYGILKRGIYRIVKPVYDNGYKTLLENQLKVSMDRSEEIKDFYDILDRVYKMFSDPETRELIVNSGLGKNELMEKYAYRILGAQRKEEDVTELFNDDLIETVRTSNKKNIHYKSNEPEALTYEFTGDDGKVVTIKNVGGLYYRTAFGVMKNVNKYIINRQGENSPEKSEEVFSNILIVCMHDPNYRNAVLSGLLGEENIARSKSNGYVGAISKQKNALRIGEEELEAGVYTYKLSDEYSIEYDAEDMTAVMIYQNEKKKDFEARDKEER